MLHRKQPKFEHLRVFGYLFYASTLPNCDKFAPRARRTVFIWYSETQKRYKLFDLDTSTFLINGDVSFREDIFPFKTDNMEQDDLFFLSTTDTTNSSLQHGDTTGAAGMTEGNNMVLSPGCESDYNNDQAGPP